MDVVGLASKIPSMIFGTKSDDDFSDRLNYRYTVALLIGFSIILTTRQYGSEVIKCWVPAHFTSNYESYVSQICWISNTYYHDLNKKIPKDEIERKKDEIKYYQWVSFVLLFQALLFYFPRIFWRTFSIKAGLNICDLVESAHNYKAADNFENRKSFMLYLVKNIDQYVDDDRRYETSRNKNRFVRFLMTFMPCFGRFMGNYIVILYFIVKILYILNTCFQVYIVSLILGKSFIEFGYEFLVNLIYGHGWTLENSKYFPKVSLCDFMIREVGNPNKSHKYTVQCVLPINLFNQQIFTAIWFWYIIVLVWNIAEMCVWIRRCLPSKANKWIARRVLLINQSIKVRKNRLKHFMETYLEPDGIFMIRMIANNTSDYVATDLVHHLWCQHADNYDKLFPNDPHNIPEIPCPFEHKSKDLNSSNEVKQLNYASFGQIFDKNQNFHRFQSFDSKINPYNLDVNDASTLLDPTKNKVNHSIHETIDEENRNLIRKRESNFNTHNNSSKLTTIDSNLPDV